MYKEKAMRLARKVRKDGTFYPVPQSATANPKILAKVLKSTPRMARLYLDYYLGYKTTISATGKEYPRCEKKRVSLGRSIFVNPANADERHYNREVLAAAETRRNVEGANMIKLRGGLQLLNDYKTDILSYYEGFIAKHFPADGTEAANHCDKRMHKAVLREFRAFLSETPEYRGFASKMPADRLTRDIVGDFADFLKSRHKGSGAHTYFARFKRFINYAVDHDIFRKSPCKGVSIKIDNSVIKKEVLTPEEITKLQQTSYENANPIIMAAFIFCCHTGLRFCDVSRMRFADIDYSRKMLVITQAKTKRAVAIPLRDWLLCLVGKPRGGDRNALVFPLPSHNMCNKALRHWVARAGIEKHITWHCARHSFGTNLAASNTHPLKIRALMGHSSLVYTEVYVRVNDMDLRRAVESLDRGGCPTNVETPNQPIKYYNYG